MNLVEIVEVHLPICECCGTEDTTLRRCKLCGANVCSDCIDWIWMVQVDTSHIICVDCAGEGKEP